MPHHWHLAQHHTQQTDGCVWLHSVLQPRPPPPFRVTSPVLGHVTLLYRLWALWFELHTAVSVCVHYRCSTSRRFTQIRRLRWNHLFSGASFRPFHNMEKLQQIRLKFFPLFYRRPDAFSQASHNLKLISPLLMNAKIIYPVTWRRESCIALSINFSRSKRSLYASTAT